MAKVLVSEKSYIEELAANQPRNLMVICERLFLPFCEESEPKEMAQEVSNKLQEYPELLGKMLRKEAIELLIDLWKPQDSTGILIEPYMEELQQLCYLGFISVEEDALRVNQEAKDIFFFSVQSRQMKQDMERYTEWEEIIFGMMFSYGILDLYDCYEIFAEVATQPGTYAELEEFLMVRIVFWRSGLLLRNQKNKRLFMASREVSDRSRIFDEWNEHRDLTFRKYTRQEYIDLAVGNGITGWDGISELFVFILEKIEHDRYQAMLIIKSVILVIQNGVTYLDAMLQVTGLLEHDSREDEKELCEYVKKLFYNIPIYGLKGHTREELLRKERFRVIEGGKQ